MSAATEQALTLNEALEWRYATKRFDPSRKISEADFEQIKHSLLLAPSSYGLQPWKFIVVKDPALRAELRKASKDQLQVTDASHFVVISALKSLNRSYVDHYMDRVAEVRHQGADALSAYRNNIVATLVEGPRSKTVDAWAKRQAYIPLGFAMLTAAELAIDSCPMEGLDHAAYDRILGLDKGDYATVVALPLGYRLDSDKYSHLPKVRFKEEEVFETR